MKLFGHQLLRAQLQWQDGTHEAGNPYVENVATNPPAFRASTVLVFPNGPTATINIPAGVQDGDFLLVTSMTELQPPTGWQRGPSVFQPFISSDRPATHTYFKTANSEPASYDFVRVDGGWIPTGLLTMMAFSNCSGIGQWFGNYTFFSGTHLIPGPPTVANSLILSLFANGNDDPTPPGGGTAIVNQTWTTNGYGLLAELTTPSGPGPNGSRTYTTASGSVSAALLGIEILGGFASGAFGMASGSADTTGSATGAVLVKGNASGNADTTGAAAGAVLVRGSASGAADTTGTATGRVLASGAAAGNADTTGAATGAVRVSGAASGAADTTGTANGTVSLPGITGTASGNADTTGQATGAVLVQATASGSADTTGSATGEANVALFTVPAEWPRNVASAAWGINVVVASWPSNKIRAEWPHNTTPARWPRHMARANWRAA